MGTHLNYLNKFIKAYVMGTHLNCIDKSMQFKSVPTCLYKNVDKTYMYTGCNLKTMELLDCTLVEVCV